MFVHDPQRMDFSPAAQNVQNLSNRTAQSLVQILQHVSMITLACSSKHSCVSLTELLQALVWFIIHHLCEVFFFSFARLFVYIFLIVFHSVLLFYFYFISTSLYSFWWTSDTNWFLEFYYFHLVSFEITKHELPALCVYANCFHYVSVCCLHYTRYSV